MVGMQLLAMIKRTNMIFGYLWAGVATFVCVEARSLSERKKRVMMQCPKHHRCARFDIKQAVRLFCRVLDAMRATRARLASAGATSSKEPAAAAVPAPSRAAAKAQQRSRVMEPAEPASASAPLGGEHAAARPDRDGGGADESLTAPRRSGRLVDLEGASGPPASIFPLPVPQVSCPSYELQALVRRPR